jgi:hypothetical protein
MKNEGYFEKPGEALFLDKMASLRDAAKDNGFDVVAAVYQKKYDEVKAEGSQMFVTGYEQDVMAELSRIGNIVSNVNSLFHHYLAYINRSVYDEPSKFINNVRESVKGIEENGSTLMEALNDPYNKAHVLLEEPGYSKFITTIDKIYKGAIQDDFRKDEIEANFEKAWEVLKPLKKEQVELGKSEAKREKRVVFLAYPGDKLGDDYRIVERREETI